MSDELDADAWLERGAAALDDGRSEAALEAIDRAIEIDPANAAAWANRSAILAWLDRFDEALAAGKQATELDPASAYAWRRFGATLDAAERGIARGVRTGEGARSGGTAGLARCRRRPE